MNIAQKKAIAFIRKYKLNKKTFNRDTMREILKKQGFLLLRYDKHGQSSDKVEKVLDGLQLIEYAQGKDGFAYVSSTDKVIFTSNQLGEDEELYILLHEQGHIACNHPVQHGILAYNDVLCEQEANAFVFHVMHYLGIKEKMRIATIAGAFLFAYGTLVYHKRRMCL